MAVIKKEQYRQKDGTDILKVYTKPTSKFSEGSNYFYVDAKDEDIVDSHTWHLFKNGKYISVDVNIGSTYDFKHLKLYRELAYKYLGYYPDYIDHVNGLELDNTDINLNVVTNQQNALNRPSRGYEFVRYNNMFRPKLGFCYGHLRPYSSVATEVEVCQLTHLTETDYLRGILKDDYYMYDFLKDRRNDLDILELERTGQISSDEAIYKHVVRYASDNAWYYYRYNLEQYFKDNHLKVPDYKLDEQGYMIHPVTGKKLCPF